MSVHKNLAGLFALAALVLGAVACGGDDDTSAPSERPPAEPSPVGADGRGDPVPGETVWTEAGCGGCHALAAAGSTGTAGPNLDTPELDFAATVELLTVGDGHPTFAGQLSQQEIEDLVSYVVSSTTG